MIDDLQFCLDRQAQQIGARLAVRHRDASFTFAQLRERVLEVRDCVSKGPVRRGGLVSIDASNGNWCASLIGYLGIITAGRIANLDKHSASEFQSMKLTVAVDAEFRVQFSDSAANAAATAFCFESEDPALDVVYTSGSTGKPVPYLFFQRQFVDRQGLKSPKHPLVAVHAGIPFNTSTGAHAIALRHLQAGLSSITIDPGMNWEEFLNVLETFAPFEVSTTPFELQHMLASAMTSGTVDSVRFLRTYAGPLSDRLRAQAELRFQRCRIFSIYGLTEAANQIMVRSASGQGFEPSQSFRVWHSGRGSWAEKGELGELLVNHQATEGPGPLRLLDEPVQGVLPQGWLNTGDLGTLSENGNIQLWGRAKEVVIADGRRFNALDLEEKLNSELPASIRAMVFNFSSGGEDDFGIILEVSGIDRDIDQLAILRQFSRRTTLVLVPGLFRSALGKLERVRNAAEAIRIMSDHAPWSTQNQDLKIFSNPLFISDKL